MPEVKQPIPNQPESLFGVRVFEYPAVAKVISRLQDGIDVIGMARSENAALVVLPIDRLDPAFFQLRTGLAGEILQKFVLYQLRVVVLGDLFPFVAESNALRDFVRECNCGSAIWFLTGKDELEERLRT